MILKVECEKRGNWAYYGNITSLRMVRAVRYLTPNPPEGATAAIEFREVGSDDQAEDCQTLVFEWYIRADEARATGNIPCGIAQCFFSDGSSRNIAFDTHGYLLSDSGETVERL
jgi:hypothetical protein